MSKIKIRTREQEREKKRRQRERYRQRGLNAWGKPLKSKTLQQIADARFGRHPRGCVCYDCLWGDA